MPLAIETMPDPMLGTGEVIVDVVATPVLSYAQEVFSGERQYPIELPIVPGCGAIGRVRQTAPDATKLQPGDWVFCDPTVRSRDDAQMPDIVLQGWRRNHGSRTHAAGGAGADRLRDRPDAAVGARDDGACCGDGGAPVRARGADGRRRHARRCGA
ncbi:hypothetical protein BSLA_02f3766 [Burkholderia stabilis]|nr:hypothetical protein BSLA_02f3766 [Burkholderia stabilis]